MQLDNWHFIKESVIAAAALRRTDAAGAGSDTAAGAGEAQQAGDAAVQESNVMRILNGFAYTGGSTLAAARALEAPVSQGAGGGAQVQVSGLLCRWAANFDPPALPRQGVCWSRCSGGQGVLRDLATAPW